MPYGTACYIYIYTCINWPSLFSVAPQEGEPRASAEPLLFDSGDAPPSLEQQEHIYRGPARSAQRLDELFYYFNRFLLFLGSFFLCCGVVFIDFHVF